jgi:hypothetical protein
MLRPPRPLDITEHFPELRDHSATATRLHPRPGAPTTTESSVGGPLLWLANEPWPVCTDRDAHYVSQLRTPAALRRSREIYAAAQARAAASGARYQLTDPERAAVTSPDFSEPHDQSNQTIPLVPVAQLYRRDIPDFVGPDGADLLQVLWCPLDHRGEGYNPRVRLYWRCSADVTRPWLEPRSRRSSRRPIFQSPASCIRNRFGSASTTGCCPKNSTPGSRNGRSKKGTAGSATSPTCRWRRAGKWVAARTGR